MADVDDTARRDGTTVLVERVDAPGLHEHLCDVVIALGLPPSAAIVDLGCGTGAWLDRLAKAGFSNLLGLDCDTGQFSASVGRCITCDLKSELPSEVRGPFDLVTAIEVIEHVANSGAFVRSIARLMSADGYALLSTPNVQSLAARLRFMLTGRMAQFDDRGERSHITPVLLEAFTRTLERDGLAVVRAWTFPLEEPGQIWRPAVRQLVRVARVLVGDPLPGHVLCLLVRKARQPECSRQS